MAHYSFVVIAPNPIGFTKPLLMIDKGLNTFSVVIPDLTEFMKVLHTEGVVVTQVNCLDEFEPCEPSDLPLGTSEFLTLPETIHDIPKIQS